MSAKYCRYPGPQPFEDNDIHRKLFFGRDKEKESLLHLIFSENHIVLFSKSGMGKTSLINAALSKNFRDHNYLPIKIRLNNPKEDIFETIYSQIDNIVYLNEIEYKSGDKRHLWTFFKTVQFWEHDILLLPILIFDQFEELFSLRYPLEAKRGFTKQLSALVNAGIPDEIKNIKECKNYHTELPPKVKILFSLREDYLADLEEFSEQFPGIFQNRFRLEGLSTSCAKEVIEKPAILVDSTLKTSPFYYEPIVLEKIIDFLSKRFIGNRVVEEQKVEPFQIQLICKTIENNFIYMKNQKVIGQSDIQKDFLQNTMKYYYIQQIGNFSNKKDIKNLHLLFENELINEEGFRLSLEEKEIIKKFNISYDILKKLVDFRLLRSEARVGSNYYEISHDSLVNPILNSKKERESAKRKKNLLATFLLSAIIIAIFFVNFFRNKYWDNPVNIEAFHNSIIKASRIDIIDYLDNKGANIELRSKGGDTPLISSVKSEHLSIVEIFLRRGVEIESKNNAGNTPLIEAAKIRNEKILKFLLDKNALIEAKNKQGNTPLIEAVKIGNVKIVSILLEKEANIEAKNKHGNTPLIEAVKIGNIPIINLLLGNKADIEAKNKHGNTPLILAINEGREFVVKSLLDMKASPNSCNYYGDTPLMIGALSGNVSIVKLLIDTGAQINKKNSSGDTALMFAARNGFLNIVKQLIEKKADPKIENAIGMKAWHWAKKNDKNETAAYLEESSKIRIKRRFNFVPFPIEYIPSKTDPLTIEGIKMQNDVLKSGNFCHPKLEEAFKKFLSAANKKKDSFAMFKLGRAYTYGLGVVQDLKQAIEWYNRGAKLGENWSQVVLGFFYRYGLGIKENEQEAIKLFEKAAKSGNPWACVEFARYHFSHDSKRTDRDLALEKLLWAAKEKKDPMAQNELGDYYHKKGDYKNAIHFYKESAKFDNEYAITSLGTIYRMGMGVTKSYEKAFNYFKRAAKVNKYAQYYLARAYENGEGIQQSLSNAVKYYRLSAAQNYIKAKERLEDLRVKPYQ